MARRESPPTAFVLAPAGYAPAAQFRAKLERSVRALGDPATRVRLLRPPNEAAIGREVARARKAHANRGLTWPIEYDIAHIRTAAEEAFCDRLEPLTPARVALVVLIAPGVLGNSRYVSPIDYPVRRFVEARRSDLLLPVLLEGPPPSPRSRHIGNRLLAAAEIRDWRRTGGDDAAFAELAAAVWRALALPIEPGPRTNTGTVASLDVVRVDTNGNGDCFRIAEGLALARRGGRVEVEPGRYLESPRISRSVHLIGIGDRDSIRVVGSYHALSTAAQNRAPRRPGDAPWGALKVTVENLTLEGRGGEERWASTVSLDAGSVTIRDCTIEASGGRAAIESFNRGEQFQDSVRVSNCIIRAGAIGAHSVANRRCRFTNCVFVGTGAAGQQGLVGQGAETVVDRCTFVDLEWPVQATGSAGGLEVRNSLIVGGSAGVLCGCKVNARLRGVRVVAAAWGIQASEQASVLMSDCHVEGSTSGDLVVKGNARLVGWNNAFNRGGGPAIWVAGKADCLVANSNIVGAKWGAVVQDDATLELVATRIRDAQFYAAGAAGKAALFVRGNVLEGHNNGIQFVEHSAGEITENSITRSGDYGIGIWSDGAIKIRGNSIGAAGRRREFIAPEAKNVLISEP